MSATTGRQRVAVLVMVAAGCAALIGSAFAATTKQPKSIVAELTGTSVTSVVPGGGQGTTTIAGTLDGDLGPGTYAGTLDMVATEPTETCGYQCALVSGSITFSTKKGDFTAAVQPGSLVGSMGTPSQWVDRFDLYLNVVSGTHSFKHADGQLGLAYTSTTTRYFNDNWELVVTIEDEGTLTGNVR